MGKGEPVEARLRLVPVPHHHSRPSTRLGVLPAMTAQPFSGLNDRFPRYSGRCSAVQFNALLTGSSRRIGRRTRKFASQFLDSRGLVVLDSFRKRLPSTQAHTSQLEDHDQNSSDPSPPMPKGTSLASLADRNVIRSPHLPSICDVPRSSR
jgi:hypothetical protein